MLRPTSAPSGLPWFDSRRPTRSLRRSWRSGNPLIVNPINGITPVAGRSQFFDPVSFNVPYNDGGGPPQNSWDLVGRLDYNLSDKTQMFFRIGRERLDAFQGTNDYSAYSQYDSGNLEPEHDLSALS